MVKHKGRNMGRYIKGNVDDQMALSTLASGALITQVFDESVAEEAIMTSLVASWALDNIVAGQGPLQFGVAHSDYTGPEILEVIANTGSWDLGNKVAQEQAKRLVRTIGFMVIEEDTGTDDVRFNDGKPVKTKLNWVLQTGDTIQMWVFNPAATLTGNPILRAAGHANIFQK